MDKKSILLVDDEKTVLDCFYKVLSKRDYTVYKADNGYDALEILKKNGCDLVISDIMMSEMNGIELLKRVKEISPETDVIMITGYGSTINIVNALREKAVDFLTKPCSNNVLISQVEKTFENRRNRKMAKEAEIYKKMTETLGAVAHEINNPLSALIGNLEIMDKTASNNNEISDAIRSAEKISVIIKKLLEIKGFKTKTYTKDSKILDLQIGNEFISPSKRTVLVVDDDDLVCKVTSAILKNDNYKVDIAISGKEALEKIKNAMYSVIILDIHMPVMDGLETLQLINKYYTDKNIRIPASIMYTGFDVDDILQKCKDLGAYTALQKPIRMAELLKVVKEAESLT